ncbi:MAG: YihY/virulence factor BrkB family protein [Planctomycetes bacterium]|nr:YihY/virulence factor BrkB family protein [Planctomycetota bacterium]
MSRFARVVRFQVRLWQYCAQRLRRNNLIAMAAALSFHTIFALIPTLVLSLLWLSSLGLLENSKESLRQFLVATGVARIGVTADTQPAGDSSSSAPAGGEVNVADQIIALVSDVQAKLTIERIGPIGIALFIWSAISLLSTIEDALNRVFGAARNRSVVRRSLLYWSILTLGPIALAITIYFGQVAIRSASGVPWLASVAHVAGWLGPTMVGILLLSATYSLLPNTHVNRQAALGGAVAAVLLWLVARWAFALYVGRFVLNGNLYGILGALPLFLFWLYLSWLVFLFGAELTHTAANLRQLDMVEAAEPQVISSATAIAIILSVVRKFQSGQGPIEPHSVTVPASLRPETVEWLLERLTAAGLLVEVGAGDSKQYLPTKPADQIPVMDVLNACEVIAASGGDAKAREGALSKPFHIRLTQAFHGATLADLMVQPPCNS